MQLEERRRSHEMRSPWEVKEPSGRRKPTTYSSFSGEFLPFFVGVVVSVSIYFSLKIYIYISSNDSNGFVSIDRTIRGFSFTGVPLSATVDSVDMAKRDQRPHEEIHHRT